MNPKEKAEQLIEKHKMQCRECGGNETAKIHSLIAVTEIINSNPHSNPFNTDIHSTMQYWIDVKTEIEKL
jgi:hypothetical protein